jgi:anti-anti-sigma factor
VSDIRYLSKVINGVAVVTAPAEIDITTADQLRAVLLYKATQGHVTVVVDMTRTRFCDSCGLHTLLRAHRLAWPTAACFGWSSPPTALFPESWP